MAGHVRAHVRRRGGGRQAGHGVTRRTRRTVRSVIEAVAVSVIEELTQLMQRRTSRIQSSTRIEVG